MIQSFLERVLFPTTGLYLRSAGLEKKNVQGTPRPPPPNGPNNSAGHARLGAERRVARTKLGRLPPKGGRRLWVHPKAGREETPPMIRGLYITKSAPSPRPGRRPSGRYCFLNCVFFCATEDRRRASRARFFWKVGKGG